MDSRESKLLVMGDNAFDFVLKARLDFENESNVFPERHLISAAGSGVNFAVAACKLGLFPFYFTPISRDSFGKTLKEYLKENLIEYAPIFSNKDTALIFTLLNEDGGRNTIAMIQNTSYTDISCTSFLKLKMKFKWAYISGGIITEELPQREVVCIAEYLAKNGVKLFFDPQFRIGKGLKRFLETAISIIRLSSYVFINDKEFEELPKSFVDERVSSGTTFVIKKGEKGAALLSNGTKIELDGLKVSSIDTTGAGDIFNAAYMKSLLANKSKEECLKYANKVAALSTEKMGIFVPIIPF